MSRSRLESTGSRKPARSLRIFAILAAAVGLFLLTAVNAQAAAITGQVFEDKNYGGGAGRSFAAAAGVGRPNVRIELYNSANAFLSSTLSTVSGTYTLAVPSAGTYYVRAVDSTVRSARVGSNATEVSVQTYITDASSGTALPVTDKIGGEQPAKIEAPANSGSQTLTQLRALAGQYPQSVAAVAVSSIDVGGVDFGFNFDTIVSTRDAGQGSLRQFILNANVLTDDASLSQSGRTPGRETSIFMIPTTDPGYLASPLAYTIKPLSALATVTNQVILDATTQPEWTGAPIVELLGTSAGGTSNGLTITAGNSTVRGFVIGKFGNDAIDLTTGNSNKIAGNYLGTTVAGTVASANGHDGIYVTGSKNNVLGGTTAADRNVIAGNTFVGIEITGTGTTGNVIQGNYIGLDATGNVALLNRDNGIDVSAGAGQTTIGGTAPGAGNVISGNNRSGMNGIWIDLGSGNTIQGNKIGTNAAGTAGVPNAHGGIVILDSNNNAVGGTTVGAGNVIAFNAIGVVVQGTSQNNAIRLNSIYSNTGLGIDLGSDGLTRNDLGDADIGANDLRNFSVIQYAGIVGTNLVLAGWARPNSAIDFFVAAPDANGFGEGQTPLTTLTENSAADSDSSNGTYANPVNGLNQGTDTTNRFSFKIPLPAGVVSGTKLTSTATIGGETSEFGGNVTATLMPDLGITKTDGLAFYRPGQALTYTIVVTNTGSAGVVGASVSDVLPAALTSPSWTCVAAGGASCAPSGTGSINDTVTVPVNGTLTYTVTATVAAGATGNLVNTAVVTPPVGVIDPVPDNNSATDTDPPPTADLSITKTDGLTTYTPGLPLTYTIVVTNAGPTDAVGATVTDAFPAGLTNVTWTCVAAAGASCTASGSGNISDTVTLPVGKTVTYTATATVASSATASIKNTATVTAPPTVVDPVSSNNSASDQDTKGAGISELAVTKTDGVATYASGGTVTYTIVATNLGPSDALASQVTDLVTNLPQVASASWTCVATGGGSCSAGPKPGNINAERVDLPVGGTVTFTLVTTLASSATGNLVNTASIAPPNGSTDPTPANNTASDTDTQGSSASDLAITKTDNVLSYSAGGTLTYTIKVTNAGPANAVGATVSDTFPAGVVGASWTCSAQGGGTCTASGSGNINDTVNVPVGATLTYTANVTLASSLTTALTNTATVSVPAGATDPAPANNAASDTDTLGTSKADLQITKTDGVASYLAGGTLTYTIVVGNSGPADVAGATVTDIVPAALTNATWTCAAAPGASCTASGSGNINDSVSIPLGSSVTYTLTAHVVSSATGSLKNTASVSPPGGVGDPQSGNNSATDEDNQGASACDLAITKSDGVVTYAPGGTVTYTIVATNLGPSDAFGAKVTDLVTSLPQVAGATWMCVATGGANCRSGQQSGSINGEHVDVPVGGTVTFTLVATLDSSATGDLVNTASVSPNSGSTDPVATNNAASDTDAQGSSASDLAITKTDGVLSYSAGGTLTYTIKVTNAGPGDATGATVQDTFPAGVVGASWTCSTQHGGSCTASGSGNIDDSVYVPVGATLTYTATVTLSSSLTTALTNTATVSAPAGSTDPVPANNSASDTDTLGTSTANLGITKTDGVVSYLPGGTLIYTIVVGNSGPANVVGATVTDILPAALTNATWTCVAGPGASCTAGGSGNINDSVSLPLGSNVTYTVTAVVASSTTGNLTNTASVSPPAGVGDPVSGNNSASDQDNQGALACDLVITKSDGVATYAAGGTVTYTIVAQNLGPSDAIHAQVSDLVTSLPQVASASWTCVATGGAACAAGPKGGSINAEPVDLPVGGTVTFTLVATMASSASGNLVNTATIVPPSGLNDPAPLNNTASDTDTQGSSSSDLAITKTDGALSYSAGGTLTYTIKVTNAGPANAAGATVHDTFPAGVVGASWTCSAQGGGSCTASGSGNIDDSVNVPVGATLTYIATVTLNSSLTGALTNTATVSAPAGSTDPVPANNSASDTDTLGTSKADLGITKTDGVASYLPGGTLTYTIVVSNFGPANVAGATVTDTFAAGIASATWTCAPAAGASCTASGSGNINDSVTIPLGSSVTYTVTAVVTSSQTGNFKNTASVSPPAGVGDPVSGNNTATDEDSQGGTVAELVLTKSDGTAIYTPGGTITYTIAATNLGPGDAMDSRLSDLVTSLPQVASASWTCVATGGAACTAGPRTGSINAEHVDLPVGGTVTFTLVVTLKPSATGTLVNTASVAPHSGTTDPNGGNNVAQDTDLRGPAASDLKITKSDGVGSYAPGGTLTYTIVATNDGPSDAIGAQVTDPVASLPQVSGASWTCVGTGGAVCSPGPRSGSIIAEPVDIPVGGAATFTLVATLAPVATGDLTNTATIAAQAGSVDAIPGNNSATDTDTQAAATADLGITNSDGVATYTPGGTLTYTIVVSNFGPGAVTGAKVSDVFPASIASAAWSCAPSAGATCTATGSGNINDTVNLPAGKSLTYTVAAVVDSSASGFLANTASVSPPLGVGDPVSSNNSATDQDSAGASFADLVVTKTDGVSSYVPGGTLTYTITATNLGPADAIDARLSDLVTSLPQVAAASWTCVASGGAACNAGPQSGDISAERVDLPVGGTATFTLVVTLSPSATGNLVNTASVVPPSGTTDPTPANNSASDTDTRGALSSDLAITKSDGVTSYSPGGTVTYAIKVTNLGPSDATGAKVQDTFPAGITSASWTCAHSAGASCTTIGTGNIDDTVNVPVGGILTYTVVATIAPSLTGNLVNTATVSAPTGTTDPSPVNDSASDTDSQGTSTADLAITKTDGVASYVPGGALTYTIVVSNAGPADVAGANVSDTFPAAIASASWSCAPSAGASCTATGSGNINDTVSLPAGKSVTYTVTAAVSASASGNLTNTASVSPPAGVGDPVSGNNSASDQDSAGALVADLVVTKTDGVASYVPGGTLTYTITATNLGPGDAIDARLSDLVASLPQVASASWTCVAGGGAACTAGPQSGSISSQRVDLPVGGTATFTLVVTLNASATGSLVNTASIVPPAGETDPTPGNNAATDTDTQGAASADLSIAKSDGVATYTPGGTVTYTITVANAGPSDATGATVADALPAIVTSASWTCAPGAGATCAASGTGNINDIVGIPAGKSVVYTLTATIAPSAATNLVNTATVAAPAGTTDPTPGNNGATDTDTRGAAVADLSVLKTDGATTYTPGTTTTYTITVANAGPSNVSGAAVTDALPAIVSGATWTCAPGAGAACTPSGTGNIADTVSIPAGKNILYTVTATIASSATVDLVNTATVAAPGGVNDPTPGNNAATDTDTRGALVADLTMSKSDGVTTYTPGGTVTYTIKVGNVGPTDAPGATVTDLLPAIVSSAAWTCVPTSGATCAASGSGNINDTVLIPAGGTLVYTVTATIASSAAVDLVNTATVAVPAGFTDPTPADNSATDTDTKGAAVADLVIGKTDGQPSYIPGGSTTYTIVVKNDGPSDATGAVVTDVFPAALTSAAWTCAASAGATCTASGNGNLNDTVKVPVGGTVTYTVVAAISPSASGSLVNTAVVTPPTGIADPNPGNNTSTDTDTVGSVIADLGVTKTDGVTSYIPGTSLIYTIVVHNAGPSDALGATVTDLLPPIVTGATWTCTPAAGASCAASGSGSINDTVNLPAGKSLTYTLSVTTAPGATGDLVNTAHVAAPLGVGDPVASNDSATDTDTRGAPVAELSVTKTDGVTSYTPGGTVTYTITVANAGPSDATGATVADALPAIVTGATWTCAPGAGATCAASGTGNINDTVTIPPGKSVIYALTATTAPSAATNLVNTATVAAPAGTTDPTPGNNGATDTDTRGAVVADLSVLKTDGATTYTPGSTTTYTITVANAGPSNVLGATVTDTLSAIVTGASWTCAPGSGATCAASGTGNINDTVAIPAGKSVVYTMTATIAPSAVTNLVNTATVAAPAGTTDPAPGNNGATDTDTLGAAVADLSVTKTDGVTTYTPGGTVTYTITVANAGPSNVSGATITDTLPAIVTSASWTCAPGTGATCAASGSGNINDTVAIPAGKNVVYTLTATVAPSAATNLVNTATVAAPATVTDPVPGNDAATDTDTRGAASADLSITKTDGVTSYTPGGTVTYTITVANAGPSDATGATVADALPAIVTGATWTCAPGAGATCATSGSGNISDTVNIPAGRSVVYTLTATTAPSAATNLVNTATVAAPAGTADPTPGNNGATDTDTRGAVVADLSVTKTDGVTTYTPGGTVTYTITVANAGPSNVSGATIADTLPPIVTGASWTCTPGASATCAASGTGNINDTVAIPAGRSVVYTLTATIAPSAATNLVNTATATTPSGTTDPTPGNNGATDTDTPGAAVADLSVTKNDGVTTYTPGGTVTYTITVANGGPSNVSGATVTDTLPAIVTGATWSCSPGAGAVCAASGTGNINDTVAIPAGRSVVYTMTATVAPSATTNLVNTATVAAPTAVTDPVPGNDAATDTDTRGAASADLSITKTDGVTSYTPGGTVTYTITVANAGPSDASGATVADALPAIVTGASWTCAPGAGATCAASGSGNISDIVTIPAGRSVVYTLIATISPAAAVDLVNTATVSAPVTSSDLATGNNSATDTDRRGAAAVDLSVVKTSAITTYTPGGSVTYTITVANAGPSDAVGATVRDTLPAILTGATWTCAPGTGATCAAGGTGSINDIVTIPVGKSVVYTLTATIASSASADLTNTATVAPPAGATDGTPANNASSVTNSRGSLVADLSVTNSDGVSSYTPGGSVIYHVTVHNAGPSDASLATIAGTLPSFVTTASWTCSGAGGSTCAASGTGAVNDTVNLPAGTSVTYTITAVTAPSATGDLVHAAVVSSPAGVMDPDGTNNAATDTDTQGAAAADLQITKTDGVTSYLPGDTLTYIVTATNAGPSDVTGARIADLLPASLAGATWTCAPSAGAACAASGAGDIADTVNLPVGSSVVYTLVVTVAPSASGTLANTATIAPPIGVGDPVPQNDTATDSDVRGAAVRLTKTASQSTAQVGGAVGYFLTATNGLASALTGVTLQDLIPAGFKYVDSSAIVIRRGPDGVLGTSDDVRSPIPAAGNRPVVFGPFDLAAHESVEVGYALRVGSGVGQGDHENVAEPFQGGTSAGPTASAKVTVVADPVFDQSTIVGKVYEDKNRNDWQDPGEEGVPQVMVALDDGTYALTDEFGRFHFPATNPGHRMVKINMASLPPGTQFTGEDSRILWITPGVPVRADFGVILPEPMEKKIGSPGEKGVAVSGLLDPMPIEVRGNISDVTVLVNDTLVPLSTSDVKLEVKPLDEIIRLVGNALPQPVTFRLKAEASRPIEHWSLAIADASEHVVKTIEGDGALPDSIPWDATTSKGELIQAGQVYQYQLSLAFADGARSQSAKRIFGVNRETVVSLELTGDAFATGKAELTAGAKKTLDRAAQILAEYPREKVVIEGHTDSVGSAESNLELSKTRAEAAREYLVGQHGVAADRLTLKWFGEEKPKASNEIPEGRAVNRRVEIKGEVQRVEQADLNAHLRVEPFVYINQSRVTLTDTGRFASAVLGDDLTALEVEMANGQGRTVFQTVALPELKLELPRGEVITEQGAPQSRCVRSGEAIVCRVQGRTSAGNSVLVDGKPVDVAADGTFTSELAVRSGGSIYPVIVRNRAGVSRGANVSLSIADHDGKGNPVIVSQAIPNLTLNLPPDGSRLPGRKLQIAGTTDPGSQVTANGQPIQVAADGRISGSIDLPAGHSSVIVEVKDKNGSVGRIESAYEVPKNQLFMLALADGEFGKMSGKGQIDAAGKDKADDYYSEGRVAFYLKGVIAGKYLITSSFDSDRQNNGSVFKDLNGTDGSRLLTNLDPDRYYPVYGDDSTLTYDVESQGKFYLALDSDTMSAVVGDYPLAFKDTELAAYQRTLYGARYAYRSLARTKYGDPDTSVIVFAAQVRQAHVRDELRATGGSLYYLSHQAIVEGSEQVTLVVRDKNTRLLKSQEPQRQNVDYTIKYPEGRVLFLRPISSVVQGGSIVDQQILSGDPVYIQVDYEAAVQGLEKTAEGARVRQQVGDHVAVGGTYVKDDLQGGQYQLAGVDTEVKLGKSTRLTAEYAASSGADSLTYSSEDGGVTFSSQATSGTEEGTAFKVGAEIDVGEWFQKPDRYRVRFYYKDLEPGFLSSGNLQEQGTTKAGANADLALTANDSLRIRYDQEERTGSGASLAGATKDTNLASAQWEHRAKRWGTTAELFQNVVRDVAGNSLGDSSLVAARGWMKFTDKLSGRLEHQQTISGVENNQTTAGIDYQVLPFLALEAKGTAGSRGNSAEAGAVYTKDGTSVYLTERTSTDQAGDRTATVLGARSPLGANSKVYTEYQWEDTDAGKRAISLVGIQRQWDLGPGFRFVLSGENAHVNSDAATSAAITPDHDRTALAASVSYQNPETWSVLSRNEFRLDGGPIASSTTTPPTPATIPGKRRQILTFNQFSYKLNADLSLVGKLSFSTTENTDTGVTEAKYDERSIGVAYRPTASDRFNALGRYTHLSDLRPVGPGTVIPTDRSMDVFSTETIFRITSKVEWAAKLAAKMQKEALAGLDSVKTDTLLTIQRFNLNLWKPFDLGLEYRILRERQTNDQRQGWLGEFMWKPVKYFRVGVGYNFTDFSDNEFSANDYSQSGWFVRVQGRY